MLPQKHICPFFVLHIECLIMYLWKFEDVLSVMVQRKKDASVPVKSYGR